MAKNLYIANMKVDCVRQNGIDLILLPNKVYELDETDEVNNLVESKVLRAVESGKKKVSNDSNEIPEDFPHYGDLVAEQDDTPTFKTLDDIEKASDEELMSKHGIGPASVKEIRKALKKK